tara:strand:+ start:5316 stop:5969 length:654 start_codon:yes stop_codon:yes gene_type:complete
MYNALSIKLEDVGNTVFSTTDKGHAIGIAQRTIASILDATYLKELERKSTNVSTSVSWISRIEEVDLHEKGIYPYGNKITLVQVPTASNVAQRGMCKMVGPDFIDQDKNQYISSDIHEIMVCHYGKKLLFSVTNARNFPGFCHITYIVDPVELTDYTNIQSSIPLSTSLHRLVLDIAEAELWHRDKKYERSITSYTKAHTTLKTLNERLSDDYREQI